jgi:hypothetical protein
MPVKSTKEEQIALPHVGLLSVFIDTIKLPVQTRLTCFVVLIIESAAPRNKRVGWQRILFSFIYFQIAHVQLLHFCHFHEGFIDFFAWINNVHP